MHMLAHLRLMARYNAWQNTSLVAAADTLTDAARNADRGAFFGSITATFNHLLLDDALWLARFGGDTRPEVWAQRSLTDPAEWAVFKAARTELDQRLTNWADALGSNDLEGSVTWYPGGGDVRVEKPRPVCFAHMFNHQTHHRGQIHGMLTAAGAVPDATDLPMML